MVVIPKDLLIPDVEVVFGANEDERIGGWKLEGDILRGTGDWVGIGIKFGRRAACVYLGEDVEVLNVPSIAKPFLVFLHNRIEYQKA